MSINELGSLGEFIASIAVVVTLGLLIYQLRQNTASVKANAFQAWVQSTNSPAVASLTNDSVPLAVVHGLTDITTLDDESAERFTTWLALYLNTAQATFFLYSQNAVPKSLYDKEIERAAHIISLSGGKQFWEAGARTFYADEFVSEVEDRAKRPIAYRTPLFSKERGFYTLDDG